MRCFRVILVRVGLALLIAALVCWPGTGRTAWAQEDATSPSLDFRADPLEVEVRKEGEPPAAVTVSNGDGTGLEFSTRVEGGEGLFRTEAAPSLSFLGDPLELEKGEDQEGKEDQEEEIVTNVVVRNDSDRTIDLVFSSELTDAKGDQREVNIDPQSSTSARPNSVTPVKLKVDANELEPLSMPLEGFLVVSGKEGKIASGTLPITVSWVDPRPRFLGIEKEYAALGFHMDTRNLVMLIPFVVSLVVVALACVWFYRKAGNWTRAPLVGSKSALGTGLELDFGTSWATLITGATALVTGFTGAEIFPDVRATFTDKEITVLMVSFGGLLILAPTVYNGIRWREPYVSGNGSQETGQQPEEPKVPVLNKTPELQGYILALLAASVIILGALLGQLAIVLLLINEIENANVTGANRWVLWIFTATVMLYAAVYAGKGVLTCLHEKVRWVKELEERKSELGCKLELCNGRKSEIEQKQARERTDEENKELEQIREEIAEINAALEKIDKILETGVLRRPLRML